MMLDKMTPEEPEHIACEICLKQVPIDEASSFEGTDYVIHFCGLECYEKWQQGQRPEPKSDR